MNAKDFMIHTVQQERVWLTLAMGIVRADVQRQRLEQQLIKGVSHAEVRHG